MPPTEILSSRQFPDWLRQHNLSLALTTYQTGQLFFLGVNPAGQLSGFQRLYDRAMGLHATPDRLYLSCKYQLWQLDNTLEPGDTYKDYDKLYVPRIGHTTGDLDIHDVTVDKDGQIIFVSTHLNCLATVSDRRSCKPLWKPSFISRVINEDRCHLNGLAMVDGKPGYVSACSRSDIVDGWRDRRTGGGVIIDVASNEIVCTGLSMPHSPRWYQGKLWVLNSGEGELGYVDFDTGKFEAVAFCPGYLRGLAFHENYAIVGLSKPRSGDKTFSGLPLDDRLQEKDADARCGLMVVDLETGAIAQWVRLEGQITELYDVQVLPGIKRPMALGFQTEEIAQLISLEPLQEDLTSPVDTKSSTPRHSAQRAESVPSASVSPDSIPHPSSLSSEQKAQTIWLASYPRSGNTLLRTILWQCFGLHSASRYPQDLGDNPELAKKVGHIEPNSEGQLDFPSDGLKLIKTHEAPTDDSPAIYVVRDGRAACVSLYHFYDQQATLAHIIQGNSRFGSWSAHLNAWQPWSRPHTLVLKYEEMVADLEGTLQTLSQFLGREIVNHDLPTRSDLAASGDRWIRPPTDWRQQMSDSDLALLESLHGPGLKQMGYPSQAISIAENEPSKVLSASACPEEVLSGGQIPTPPNLGAGGLKSEQLNAQALLNRSRTLKKQGQLQQAEACLREAIALQPDLWGAQNNLGTILQNRGDLVEAKQCYERAIAANPNFAQAVSNLASIWQLEERIEEAKESFIRAIQLKPDYFPAHFNLATIYRQQTQLPQAIEHFQKVIQLVPTYTDAYFSLGQIFEYQDQAKEALSCYQKVQDLDPSRTHIASYIGLVQRRLCQWQNYEEQVNTLKAALEETLANPSIHGFNSFVLNSFPIPQEKQLAAAQRQSQSIVQMVADSKQRVSFPHNTQEESPKKLRVGYMSPDFRDHAVGRLIKDLFPHHDRTQFEIYAYSTVEVNDTITQAVRSGCDQFVELAALSTEAAAQRIYDDGIHILIDLAGFTIGNGAAILALQPAPIQAHWLGYPNTLGNEFIQYYLGDRTLIPSDLAKHYAEEIVYLPHAFVASPLEISQKTMRRSDHGLPEDAFVFCCFNAHYKITPDLFACWLRLLDQVPNSVLWLGSGQGMENLRLEAQRQGGDSERLIFADKLPHDEYLARYALADLYLDTWVYTAGSTAAAVMWSGLPLLTCTGKTNAARMGASICRAAGLGEMICETPVDYEQRSIYLATHPEELKQIRQRLRESLQEPETYPSLFQVEGFVRSLESAFQDLWNKPVSSDPGRSDPRVLR